MAAAEGLAADDEGIAADDEGIADAEGLAVAWVVESVVGGNVGQSGSTLNKNGITETPDDIFMAKGSWSSLDVKLRICWRISCGVRGLSY